MSKRGFRDSINSFIPVWMKRPNIARYLYSMLLPIDEAVEATLQGVSAEMPGLGTPTALAMLGRSRGILRGEAETDNAYAARLRAWLVDWEAAGTFEAIAKQLHAYLGNAPLVRVISRSGVYVTVAADGTVSRASAAWNWDSASNPERAGWWSDIWIVVYACEWPVQSTIDPAQATGVGHACSREAVDAILSLVRDWKAAHTYVATIVWSYDATLFDPATPGTSGNPDGTWGSWSKIVNGVAVPARNSTCRYWEPETT